MLYAPTLPYPERSEAFQPGALLNGFKVGSLVSQGAHASVFACGADRLLLVYHAGREPNRTLRQRLKTCKSEHLCSVLQSGTAARHEYDIVPRYQKRQLDWRKLSPSQRLALIANELKAIDELHQWGFCHLDIKPEHFLVDDRGSVRLIDYGTAMAVRGSRTGMQFQFTPQYAAPEIVGGGYATASDVYSYGVILKEREALLQTPTSECISAMIMRMASQSPERRPSISEMIAVLIQPKQRIKLLPVTDRREMDRIVRARRQRQTELRNQLMQELIGAAHRAEPALAVTQFHNIACIPDDLDRIEAALRILKSVPKASTVTNLTNITPNNVCTALSAPIITELPVKTHGADPSMPENFLPAGSLYIFKRCELTEWQKTQKELRQKRTKRAWKIVGAIVLGAIVIAALPYLIGFALIVLIVGSLLNLF